MKGKKLRKNNNNNNNKRKLKNNKKRTFKIYDYNIRTAIVNFTTPTYTAQNLDFQVYRLLRDTVAFSKLREIYQQYRLNEVTLAATPRSVEGTDPAPIWIYLDVDDRESQFDYNSIQELQGSKSLPVKHFSLTTFHNTGRQDDFHYWYGVWEGEPNLSIRLHCEALPNDKKFWQFQLGFSVSFRGFVVTEETNKEIKGIVQKVKFESNNKKEQGIEDNEDSEEDWNHIDSDWE